MELRERAAQRHPNHAWTWAALMRRVFDLDALACPRYGGRLRLIATVHDALAVQAILAHGRSHPVGSGLIDSGRPVRRPPAWTRPDCPTPRIPSCLTRRPPAGGPSDGAPTVH